MDQLHYLHVHIPGRGRLTLSLPGGVMRALENGRLPVDAEAWHDGIRLWILAARHPAIANLLEFAGQRDFFHRHAQSDMTHMTDQSDAAHGGPVDSTAQSPTPDPTQLPLLPIEDAEPHHEFFQFLQRSAAVEERRKAVRTSGGVRRSGPARVFVAGAAEIRKNQRRLKRLVARYPVPGWAAALALLVLGTGAIGLFFLGRATGTDLPAPVTTTNALAGSAAQRDTALTSAALGAPNPLASEERELENNLRISEVVVWQPAIDFSSPEQLSRSSRKVDAVRNSISLYRIGAWRLIDSAYRDTDPRLEPYGEATRIDAVLNVMQSAVTLLDSLAVHFQVSGELLVFDDAAAADQYLWLRNRADSLLKTPIEGDSLLVPRAPRRVVSRLLETLPAAVVPTPQ